MLCIAIRLEARVVRIVLREKRNPAVMRTPEIKLRRGVADKRVELYAELADEAGEVAGLTKPRPLVRSYCPDRNANRLGAQMGWTVNALV